MFNPPASPTNGAEFTYGNVVWQYQQPPGVWSIKDGTLVGTDGVGVSGFFIGSGGDFTEGHLYFYYVYADGTTSDEVDIGLISGGGGAGGGLTFMASDGTKDSVEPAETLTITGAGPAVRTTISGNNMKIDVRLAEAGKTGIASFNSTYFTVSGVGDVSLNSGYTVTGDTVTGPNASIKVNKTANVATIDARFAGDSLTGVASFNPRDFKVSATGHVSLTGNASSLIVRDSKGATSEYITAPERLVFGITGGANGIYTYFTSDKGTITVAGTTASIETDDGTVDIVPVINGVALKILGDAGAISTTRTKSTPDEITVNVRTANYTDTGVASFNPAHFSITTGEVSLSGAYANSATGDTVIGPNASIKVNKTNNSVTIDARNATYSLTGVASFNNQHFSVVDGAVSITSGTFVHTVNGATGSILNGVGKDRVAFSNTTGLSGNAGFLFDGTSLTFGKQSSKMTVTGPDVSFGFDTRIVDGVFKTPREFCDFQNLGTTNGMVINATGGSIQRYLVTPETDFKVKTGTGWSNVNGHVETIVVLVQSTNSTTGTFADNIIIQPQPSLFGVVGGVDIVSLMRIKTSSGGLTMGFVYSTGLTGNGYSFE